MVDEQRVCEDCGCVFSTAGYENPNATSHEHWQGCVAALQAEKEYHRKRADKSAKIIVALQVIDPRLVDVVGRVVEQQRREELERMKPPEEDPQMHNT